jgi:hypothetical protein
MIETNPLSNLLLHLNTNQMKLLFSDRTIPNDIKTKLRSYSNATVTAISNTLYLLQDSKKDTTAQLTVSESSKHVNPELEVFTLANREHKETMNNYGYRLTLLENTYFDRDIIQDEKKLQQLREQSYQQDMEIKQKKQALIDKWSEERAHLYANRRSLIVRNKEIYNQRKTLSNSFYALDKETRSKKEYVEECRTLLGESERNKNSILEINQNIDLLDRKCNLYLSETFFYYPLFQITIQQISKEEAAELLSKKGGKYKNYDIEFIEALDSEPLEDNSVKRYYYTMKNNIKKMSKKDKTKSKTNRQVFNALHSE